MKAFLQDASVIIIGAVIAVMVALFYMEYRIDTSTKKERQAWLDDCNLVGLHRINKEVYICRAVQDHEEMYAKLPTVK